ncbi:nuclear transport factor 2 family protein [uncultured Modestobacter sp.]|uniref:nuclear transport factor 2 family protein n=1 Tax=uncultured Modestobacter sp. TaxID=380048 RepID=UPI00262ABF15|nr:nuclear transport factor 2 family protein [uncultured Modestobacter sp.]
MTTTARPGWGRSHLPAITAPDPLEQAAVQQTLNRYAFALDQHDLAALGDVLTADVTWQFTVADAVVLGPVTGRRAVLDFVGQSMSTQTDQRRHHLTNVTVHDVQHDTAQAQAYLLMTSNADGNPRTVATGFYSFGLQRTEDRWCITTLLLGMDNAEA